MAIPGGPQGEVFLNFLLQDSLRYNVSKDRYLTPAPNLRSTRAPHNSQYTRYMAYSDALKNSFFPEDYPRGGHSLVSSVPMRDQKNDEKGYFFSRRAVRSADII